MNNIDHIPSHIGNLTSLSELNLKNNIIFEVPQELFYLSNLKELRLSHNKISSIPEDLQLLSIETLSLDHNEILFLPSSLFSLSSLILLDASHNKLSILPEDMSSLQSLVSLNLNNNSISSIPTTIGSLSSIEYLMLYNNSLTSLPYELVNCGQLRDLGLGGNELPSIYNLGMSAVLSTLREVQHSDPTSPPVLHDWEINFHELEFGQIIGEGAFGQVFRGKWREKEVAIKQLFAGTLLKEIEEIERETIMREFRREVGMLSRLKSHQHLVRYFGACTQPPHLYIITEFIPRGSLHELLHESYMEISLSLKIKLAKGAALGCHFLTSNDPPVYHCDLKAKNLLITMDWNIKLGDFGQSTFDRSPNAGSGNMTYVKFAAPEILLKAPHSEKSEVYSFGVILWELMSRKIPFHHQDPGYIKEFIQNGGRLEIPPDCPPNYRQLILDCWQKDPTMRPSFMEIYIRLQNMEISLSS